MPTVRITEHSGRVITIAVEDKADAVRKLSFNLLKVFSGEAVTKALNEWLKYKMEKPMRLTTGLNETMTLTYIP